MIWFVRRTDSNLNHYSLIDPGWINVSHLPLFEEIFRHLNPRYWEFEKFHRMVRSSSAWSHEFAALTNIKMWFKSDFCASDASCITTLLTMDNITKKFKLENVTAPLV